MSPLPYSPMSARSERSTARRAPAAAAGGGARARSRPWAARLRTSFGLALGLAAGAGVVLWFGRLVDLQAVFTWPRHPWWLLALVACTALLLLADAASMAVIAARAARPRPAAASFGRLGSVALEANFIGGVTSFFGLEVPYQAAALRRLGISWPVGMAAILARGLARASLLAAAAILALALGGSPLTPLQRAMVVIVAAGLVAAWVSAVLLSRRPASARCLPEPVQRAVGRFMAASAPLLQGGIRLWGPIAALQILYWSAMFAIAPAALYALGWQGSALPLVGGLALTQVLMSFSPLPGGAGAAELGFFTLVAADIPAEVGVAGLVYWRLATWAVPVLLGAALIGSSATRRRRSRRGDQPHEAS